MNLSKPNTCLNWTKSSVPKGFGFDRSYSICNVIVGQSLTIVSMLCLLMTLCTIYILMIVKVIDLCFIDMLNIKFKVQNHLLKESSKLNINLQRQDRIYYIWHFLCHEDQEKLKIPKWVIRSRKSKMDIQFNGQKKDKRTNSDLLNITQNTKDRVTRTSL